MSRSSFVDSGIPPGFSELLDTPKRQLPGDDRVVVGLLLCVLDALVAFVPELARRLVGRRSDTVVDSLGDLAGA